MDTETDTVESGHGYDSVKEYYGQVVQNTSDLKTDACCSMERPAAHIAEVLPLIEVEIKDKFYGCGSPIPLCLKDLKVLDLGCGTGRDCYVMSKLVGANGFVSGVDMTEPQIAVAKKHLGGQTSAFGYSKSNVEFILDYIEHLDRHFETESLDLVTSNCVINLTEDKEAIFEKVYQALKFGGEMYFSDVYADRRVPEEISRHPVLRGECLGGALYRKDFERMVRRVGFIDPRIVSQRVLNVDNEEMRKLTGNINFYSITYRLWKLKGIEDACEDYGHVAVYQGQIPEAPFKLELDKGHVFSRNKPERVCGNTALMLSETRFKEYFQVTGSFNEHFGTFANCSTLEQDDTAGNGNSCC